QIEPRSSSVEDRLYVLKTLRENNIRNWLSISPMFPHKSDYKKIIEQTRDFVDWYLFENLNLRAENKSNVLDIIKENSFSLYRTYLTIYKGNNIHPYWSKLEKEIIKYCEKNKIKHKMHFFHEMIRKN
ncbi:MAG: hypothetical protein LBB36_07305, partial [Fibromonadaceae bacterium]|nr:hypothetical protein [Fibromonadaceae bacterium]